MGVRVAINGFGRTVGPRSVPPTSMVPVSTGLRSTTSPKPEMLAQLLKHDSIYGRFAGRVEAVEGALVVDGVRIAAPSQTDPAKLPWEELGVDVVIECDRPVSGSRRCNETPGRRRPQGDRFRAGERSGRHGCARRELP